MTGKTKTSKTQTTKTKTTKTKKSENQAETLGFQTEAKQLLHLMIHSLYSNKRFSSAN